VTFGNGELVFIAGPCVIESRASCLDLADGWCGWHSACKLPLVFKASFDKANRTSIGSYRGPGMGEGLQVLAEVKRRYGVPVLTDIHDPSQADPVAEVLWTCCRSRRSCAGRPTW